MTYEEMELSVGDVIRVGQHLVTVLDLDGDEVRFRVDEIGREVIQGSNPSLPR